MVQGSRVHGFTTPSIPRQRGTNVNAWTMKKDPNASQQVTQAVYLPMEKTGGFAHMVYNAIHDAGGIVPLWRG